MVWQIDNLEMAWQIDNLEMVDIIITDRCNTKNIEIVVII